MKKSKNKQIDLKQSEKTKLLNPVSAYHFSGPIPSPAILDEYRKIIPNAPERILKMAEKNSDHLIKIEEAKLTNEKNQVQKGQRSALIVILCSFLLCAYALYCNYPYVAGIVASLNLVGLVTAFIFGRVYLKKIYKRR